MEIIIKGSTKAKWFNLLKQAVVYAGFFCIILMPFVKKVESQKLHGDEIYWLSTSIYFKLFFIDEDIHNKQWRYRSSYDHPPVGKYLIGLVLYMAGYGDKVNTFADKNADKECRWHFNKSYRWNINHIAMVYEGIPLQGMLYILRLSMAIIGSLACLLIFWVCKEIFNIRVGLIAALLLAYNPIMLFWGTRIMSEAPLLFFLITNMVLMILFYRSFLGQKLLRTFIFAFMIGVNIALAAGTKLTGGLTALIFLIFCILVIFTKVILLRFNLASPGHDNKIKRVKIYEEIKVILISLLIAGIIAVSFFVAMNPFLYNQPLKGIISMLRYRMQESHSQQMYYHISALTSLRERFHFIVKVCSFPFGSNVHILKWGMLLIICIGIGFFKLLYSEIKYYLRSQMLSVRSIILVWFFISFIGIIFWIPLGWERYCLPLVPFEAITLGYIIDKILNRCWGMIKKGMYS